MFWKGGRQAMARQDGIEKLVSPYTGKVSYKVRWSFFTDGVRQHRAKTFPTHKQARDHLTKMRHQLREGVYVEPSQERLDAYMERWLATMKHRWRRASTYERSARAWRVQGKPDLGAIPLARLTPGRLQAHYDAMRDHPYAPDTIIHLHGLLHQALNVAVRQGQLIRNPTEGIILPRVTKQRPLTWSRPQMQRFLAHVRDREDAALWVLLGTTGLRIGELLALSWADVDLGSGTLRIHRTVTRDETGHKFIAEGAKTPSSNRTVVLLPIAVAALQTHRKQHILLFSRPDGQRLADSTVRKALDELIVELGLPRITPHGFRHSAASLALEAGIHPKLVQEMLGHASIKETMDTYTHTTEGLQRAAVERLDAFLSATTAEAQEG